MNCKLNDGIKKAILEDFEFVAIDGDMHIEPGGDQSRKEWLNGGYMRGYFLLTRMQYQELLTIIKMNEHKIEKQDKTISALLKEIREMNKFLKESYQLNEQLKFQFETLKARVEHVISKG